MFSAARPTFFVAALVVSAAACGSADGGSVESPAETTSDASTTSTPAAGPSTTGASASTTSPSTGVVTTELVTTELVTTALVTTDLSTASTELPSEPTGAPGIDDDDAFCAAWARAIGIPQVLTIAANFGGLDTLGMARLEVLAAPAISSAVVALAANLPAELEAEREVWFTRVLGPSASRADRAVALLSVAGATSDDLSRLESVWMEALRTRDPTSPVPAVALDDPALDAIVAGAAEQFDAQVTPWLDDPALLVDDSIAPTITAYTREHCPDLSALGIGDDI